MGPVEEGTFWALGTVYLLVVVYCIRHYYRVYTLKNKPNKNSQHNPAKTPNKRTWATFFYPMLVIGCTGINNHLLYNIHFKIFIFCHAITLFIC